MMMIIIRHHTSGVQSLEWQVRLHRRLPSSLAWWWWWWLMMGRYRYKIFDTGDTEGLSENNDTSNSSIDAFDTTRDLPTLVVGYLMFSIVLLSRAIFPVNELKNFDLFICVVDANYSVLNNNQTFTVQDNLVLFRRVKVIFGFHVCLF